MKANRSWTNWPSSMATHSMRLPIFCSVAAMTGRTVQGSVERNSTASIFPQPFGFRLSTSPTAALVSSLGLSSMTCCRAYCRRVSMRRSSSAVLLLRIVPTINSSFPVTDLSSLYRVSLSRMRRQFRHAFRHDATAARKWSFPLAHAHIRLHTGVLSQMNVT